MFSSIIQGVWINWANGTQPWMSSPSTLTITSPASPGIFISSRIVNMECDLEDSRFS